MEPLERAEFAANGAAVNVLGFDVPDEAAVALPALMTGGLGWFGKHRQAGRKADVDDRKHDLAQFTALVNAYEREVTGFREEVRALKGEITTLRAQNVRLERENIELRTETSYLRAELEKMGHPSPRRLGRRESDPVLEP